jgi:ADP-ribose pyrophosphatase
MSVVAKLWGERGAGCVIRARDTGRFLIGLRSAEVDDPLTWGTWGGEVDPGETPEAAVMREVSEETGYSGEVELQLLFIHTSRTGFVYDNYLATVPGEFEPSLGWENDEARWFERGIWPQPLHFGLSALMSARPDVFGRERSGFASAMDRMVAQCFGWRPKWRSKQA